VFAGDNDRDRFDRGELETLAASIDAVGIITPPTVRPVGDRYEIIAGERRFRAMTDVLGWSEIPVTVADADDDQAASMMLAENVARVDLDPIAEARAYVKGSRADQPATEVAAAVGVSPGRVRARRALLALEDDIAHLVSRGELPVTYAAPLCRLDANRQRLAIGRYQAEPMGIDAWRTFCGRLEDDQTLEDSAMFDADTFLTVERYALEATDETDAGEAAAMVGRRDIADRLGVALSTVHAWVRRGLLPTPVATVNADTSIWSWADIAAWAHETGRR